MAFANAELLSGADIVLDYLNYEKKLEGVDLVIVGEGQTDKSTQFNKSPVAVSLRAKKYNIPVIIISGSLGKGYNELENMGIDAFFSIVNNLFLFVVGVTKRIKSIFFDWILSINSESSSGCKSTIINPSTPALSQDLMKLSIPKW